MMASPGMLQVILDANRLCGRSETGAFNKQSGFSRELLESWVEDSRNGLVVAGYVVEGTLGKSILAEPDEIPTMSGGKLKRRMSIHYVTFAAHVDYAQNSHFIDDIRPPHLVLVHGDRNEMYRLKHALQSKYQERNEGDRMEIHTPENAKTVELFFRGEKMARTVGTLASDAPTNDTRLGGVLVARDFRYSLLSPADLGEYTNLPTMTLSQKLLMKVGLGVTASLLEWHLRSMFGVVEQLVDELPGDDADKVPVENLEEAAEPRVSWSVMETIAVRHAPSTGKIEIEWEGDPVSDILADAVVACLAQVESSRASVKLTRSEHSHAGHSHGSAPAAEPKISEVVDDETEVKDAPEQEWTTLVDSLLRQHFGKDNVLREERSVSPLAEDKSPVKIEDGTAVARWVVNVDGLEVFIDGQTLVSFHGHFLFLIES